MAFLFAVIGGLIIGTVGNETAGFISFIIIWVLVAAYEDMQAKVQKLGRRVIELESDLRNARNSKGSTHREWQESDIYG